MRPKLISTLFLLCCGLAACRPGPALVPWQNPPPPRDLAADRRICNEMFPARIGNFEPHAACVNEAVERDAIPTAQYPELVRLQMRLRTKYSTQIDRGVITPREGERRMARVDQMVASGVNRGQLETLLAQP